MRKADHDAFALIGELSQEGWTPPERTARKGPSTKKRFRPKLNDGAQAQLYDSKAKNILAWSEKGSGKTWGILHKLVQHCYENPGALAVIVVKVKSMANKGGAWEKLQRFVLPEWRKGQGLEYSEVKYDQQHNEMIWIEAHNGQLSAVVLISAPHMSMIRDTMPGYEASFVFVDELDKCSSDEYYKAPAAQIGRRPGIPGREQQYVAACNPAGTRHWVYKMFFVDPRDEDTGEWDTDYECIYFPSSENEKNLPEGYFKHLAKVYRNDPIAAARLIGGEWVDRASGDSLFGDLFSVARHVRPLEENLRPDLRRRLKPSLRHPIIVGVDSGSTFHSFSLMQYMPVDGKMRWVVFDEILILKKQLTYRRIMAIVARRIRWWFDVCTHNFSIIWASDESAFVNWRPGQGSFDYRDMEEAWNGNPEKKVEGLRIEHRLPKMKLKMTPKFAGSRKARIRIMINVLSDDEIIISAACIRHQDMLRLLESEKQEEGEEHDDEKATEIKRSNHLHVFDSLTYPMLMNEVAPYRLSVHDDSQKLLSVA